MAVAITSLERGGCVAGRFGVLSWGWKRDCLVGEVVCLVCLRLNRPLPLGTLGSQEPSWTRSSWDPWKDSSPGRQALQLGPKGT